MVGCELHISPTNKQYVWRISCKHATCVTEYGFMASSKQDWCLNYQIRVRFQPDLENLTCKDQSAHEKPSTLSLHKYIISHLIWFLHTPVTNY